MAISRRAARNYSAFSAHVLAIDDDIAGSSAALNRLRVRTSVLLPTSPPDQVMGP